MLVIKVGPVVEVFDALFPLPDLSVHVLIAELLDGITPFPFGSAPSNQNLQPVMLRGSNVLGKTTLFVFKGTRGYTNGATWVVLKG